MQHNLTEIKLSEVSLVDAGANQEAHITLFKSKGADLMNIEELKKSLEATEAKAVALEKANEQLTADLAKATETAESVTKAANEAHAVEITKRDTEISKLKGDIETAVLTAEVEKRFPNTKGTTAEKVSVLKAVRAMPDEAARKAVEKSMEDAEKSITDLTKEVGAKVDDVLEPMAQLEKMGAEIAKAENLTKEQGFVKAAATPEGAKLYNQMRNEQTKGSK